MNRICFLSLLFILFSLSLHAEIVLTAPANNAVISTRAPLMQEFLSADKDKGLEIFNNLKQRAKLREERDCRPCVFSWSMTDGERGPFEIKISEKEDLSVPAALFIGRADLKEQLPGTEARLVANFEPGKRYYWQVSGKDKDGNAVSSAVGTFNMADELPRQMYIPSIPNMRDLGGRTGLDGKRVRFGMLYRSAGMNDNSPDMIADLSLIHKKELKNEDITHERVAKYKPGASRITEEGMEYIEKTLGLRTDLDLRSARETGNATASPAGKQVQFINRPFIHYDAIFKEKNYPIVAKVFRIFCNKSNYPMVFHCIGGADRTGTLACILLGVLGVNAEELQRDWLMTANPSFDIAKHWKPVIDGFAAYSNKDLPLHAQIEAYLHAIGISDAEIYAFKAIMLEEDNAQQVEATGKSTELPAELTVACVNCGLFHYGDKDTDASVYHENWEKMLQTAGADIFFLEDNSFSFLKEAQDKDNFDIRFITKHQEQKVSVVPFVREINGKKTGRYRALRLEYQINGKSIAFYGVHLVAEGHIPGKERNEENYSLSQQLRQQQFAELLADAKQFDYAVLCGDFNAQRPDEYAVFSKNGYTLTNCSERFGNNASLRKIPADNIIVSPGIEVLDFQLLKDFHLNTDHIPLKAKIRIVNK